MICTGVRQFLPLSSRAQLHRLLAAEDAAGRSRLRSKPPGTAAASAMSGSAQSPRALLLPMMPAVREREVKETRRM